MLKDAEVEKDFPSWIHLLECDICGVRFSSTMRSAWPFCSASVFHGKWSAKEQQERRQALLMAGDPPVLDFVRPALELESTKRKLSWTEDALPNVPHVPEVRILKEKFEKFRDTYFIQGYFIGNVLNKYNWTMFDLVEFSLKNFNDNQP